MDMESKTRDKPVRPKRPKVVWVITIFYFISAGWTILSYLLIYSGLIPISEAKQVYFRSQTAIDILLMITICLLNLIGASLLFFLKRQAFYVFLYAFILSMLMTAYHIMFKNWLAAIGGAGLIGAIIGWGISITVILYAKWLIRKEILQ